MSILGWRWTKDDELRYYDRGIMRSAFVSLFWGVITHRGECPTSLRFGKLRTSKWFSKSAPNWEIDTISDIASALDLEFRIQAVDRKTGTVYTPSGPQ